MGKGFIHIVILLLVLIFTLAVLAGCRGYGEAQSLYEEGKSLFNARRLEEALPCFERSIAKNRKFKQAYVMAAKCHYYQNREKAALDTLKHVLRLYPDYVDANFWMGKIYYFLHDYDLAKQYLLAVIDEDSSHIDARYLLGELYLREGAFDRAMLSYRIVGESIDIIALSKIKIAEIYTGSQQYGRALEEISFIEKNREFLDLRVLEEAWKLLVKIPVKE